MVESMLAGFRDMLDHRIYLSKEGFIKKIRNALATATRLGADTDDPEGVRYIQLSDTLVKDIVSMADILLREGTKDAE